MHTNIIHLEPEGMVLFLGFFSPLKHFFFLKSQTWLHHKHLTLILLICKMAKHSPKSLQLCIYIDIYIYLYIYRYFNFLKNETYEAEYILICYLIFLFSMLHLFIFFSKGLNNEIILSRSCGFYSLFFCFS